MANDTLKLASDFPEATDADWATLVDKVLMNETYDGIRIKPLYTAADVADDLGAPGASPYTRGVKADQGTAWDIRQVQDHADPTEANRSALNDLLKGATSLTLKFGDADTPGILVADIKDLDQVLAGVHLDLAPVSLKAGAEFPAAAAALMALWKERGHATSRVAGAFGADPVSTLAATGTLPYAMGVGLKALADLGQYSATAYPGVRSVTVSGLVWHGGGASEGQELAAMLSTGVQYLKALEAAGLSLDEAAGEILLEVAVDTDQFLTIAKIRALRMLWARVLEACGASGAGASMHIHAETGQRMYTRRDPWVNMLRSTVAGFGAAVAGADSIGIAGHDTAIGTSSRFARRVARNLHHLLAEESNLARVADPAGGAYGFERLTTELADTVWTLFQQIEAEGGIIACLQAGAVQARIAATQEKRRHNIGQRKDPITGVSEFPHINEKPVEAEAIDEARIRDLVAGLTRESGPTPADKTVDALLRAVSDGATFARMMTLYEGEETVTPVPQIRLAQDFEALRDTSDTILAATGSRPRIFLAHLGQVADFTARSAYARNFFEAGGIEAVLSPPLETADGAVTAFRESGASLAVLVSSDKVYGSQAVATARALKDAGLQRLYLAGKGGPQEAGYGAAGVDEFIYVGCDVLEVLETAMATIGDGA